MSNTLPIATDTDPMMLDYKRAIRRDVLKFIALQQTLGCGCTIADLYNFNKRKHYLRKEIVECVDAYVEQEVLLVKGRTYMIA
jgi:hypothetical protein